MRIIILCQGYQHRLPEVASKHFISVAGKPIIHRTVDLLEQLGWQDIVVVSRWEWSRTPKATLADPCGCILERINQSRALWGQKRTLFLLGDVVWSKAALRVVVEDQRPLMFAGQKNTSLGEGDLFAVAWRQERYALVERALAIAPCGWEKHETSQPGHLRLLLTTLLQAPGAPRSEWKDLNEFLVVDDFTHDIDKPEDLLLIPALENAINSEES